MKSIPLHGTMHECKCPYCTATVGAVTVSEKSGRTSDFPPVMLLPLRPPAENSVAGAIRKSARHVDRQTSPAIAETEDWDRARNRYETAGGATPFTPWLELPTDTRAAWLDLVRAEDKRAESKRPNPPTANSIDGSYGAIAPGNAMYDGSPIVNTTELDAHARRLYEGRDLPAGITLQGWDFMSKESRDYWRGIARSTVGAPRSPTVTPAEKSELLGKLDQLRDIAEDYAVPATIDVIKGLSTDLKIRIIELEEQNNHWRKLHHSTQADLVTARQDAEKALLQVSELTDRAEHFRQERDACRAAHKEALDCLMSVYVHMQRADNMGDPYPIQEATAAWRKIKATALAILALAHPATREGDSNANA